MVTRPLTCRIAIDNPPLGVSPHTARDYTAFQVFGLTSLPLCRSAELASPKPLAAHTFESDPDYCRYTFYLKRFYWQDGARLLAEDYARALTTSIRGQLSPFRLFLRDIKGYGEARRNGAAAIPGIRATDDALTLELEVPNVLLPQILTCIGFSPVHATLDRASAGPYRLVDSGPDGEIILRANPHFPTEDTTEDGQALDDVHFRVISDRYHNVDAYLNGQVDLTCDTMFPYDLYTHYKDRRDFHRRVGSLFLVLHICNVEHPLFADRHGRHALSQAIDRTSLARRFSYLIEPIADFLPAGWNLGEVKDDPLFDPDEAIRSLSTQRAERGRLRIAFHDFFPNRQVLRHIAEQLSEYGIVVDAVEADYAANRVEADARLDILSLPFEDPFAIYLCAAYSRFFADQGRDWESYLNDLWRYQSEPDPDRRRLIGKDLMRALARQSFLIPLLRMPRLFLCRPGFVHNDLCPGSVIRFDTNYR